jgi:YidC/Oxa1 family membrane protein insertase
VVIGFPNYGIAIILITIVIKLALYPLTQKQMKSMQGMKDIQPKLKQIQEHYSNDKEKMNQKTMELYKENNVSPLGGCLPMLIQLPIFLAFYRALLQMVNTIPPDAIAYTRFLWIPNICLPDPFYLIAILAAGTTYIQQRQTMTDAKDGMQRNMLYIMPCMMGFIAISLPAGLPLYWIIFNLLGILQQHFIGRDSKTKQEAVIDVESAEGNQENDGGGSASNASRGKKGKKRRGSD